MRRRIALGIGMGLAAALVLAAAGQALAAMPTFETKKITDNVYVFRYQFHQSMFVVTPDGVIATDPIGFLRPQAVTTYIDEIRKVTQAPIRYLVYSHHHYDHIAGGKPFKDAGATIVAHRAAKAHLERLKNPDVPIPDLVVDDRAALTLGGTRLDLIYTGRNHSDNSLVMLLPKEKLLFAVDFLPIEQVMFRNGPDSFIPDWFDSIDRTLALDWDRMIPGHPGPGGRLGTKEDVRAYKQYMMDVSDAAKQAAAQGKCWDAAMKEIKLPKYEKWANYDAFLPGNIERFCSYWGRGY
ncbi:MAG TPA: MBL fold metallo-hydrolase [Candidatus Methylomirabilis sp.]|jgi:glyoxylase-like metal-dependent hydrolase (beta-lactamase superfamily II)